MSEFVFNDEHAAYEAAVAALARREFMSTYLERAARDEMPWAELKRLAHHNLLDLGVPEEFGGQEADPITIGIACEQVAYTDFNLSYLVFGANAGLGEILGGLPATSPSGSPRRSPPATRSGRSRSPNLRGGSDAARPTVRAEQVEGGFRLTGEKTSVTLGMHSREILVVATTDPSAGSQPRVVSSCRPTTRRSPVSSSVTLASDPSAGRASRSTGRSCRPNARWWPRRAVVAAASPNSSRRSTSLGSCSG